MHKKMAADGLLMGLVDFLLAEAIHAGAIHVRSAPW